MARTSTTTAKDADAVAAETASNEGVGLESGTPLDAAEEVESDRKGIHLAKPRRTIVGNYEERPYAKAVTADHRTLLESMGRSPEQVNA